MAENTSCLAATNTEISAKLLPPVTCDMEEGELPDSDDEIDCKQLKDKDSQAYTSFRQSNYRSVIDTDDDDSDSDDENSWKRKKQKVFQQPRNECVQDDRNYSRKPPVIVKRTGGKKVNNIWGSVIQEQTEDIVSSRLTTVGLDFSANRGVESYNHQRSLETETTLPFGTHRHDVPAGRNIQQAFGDDDDLFADRIEPPPTTDVKDDVDGMENDAEEDQIKRNAKQRLGKRPQHLPSVIARKIDINPGDGIKIVAGNIAYSLWEPKRHLVHKTVEMIGTEKSVEIYNKAMEIEEGGGMLINNKKRRRSPGGVFFHLLRNDYGIEKQILDEIFEADVDFLRNGQKEKKDKKKRKQSSNKNMDVTVSEKD